MATSLNKKLSDAINMINISTIKPSEIASLMKTAAELERKARIDTEAQEDMKRDLLVDPEMRQQKKTKTDKTELSEVISILAKAGVLEGMTIKKTTTTTTEVNADNSIDVDVEVLDDGNDEEDC